MNYGNIKFVDVADGEGVRVSLFVSGCRHHCKGCFQPETWNFDYGNPFTEEVERQILVKLSPSHINGLSLLGGEPFEPENQRVLFPFLRKVKAMYPEKTIWAYSGYLFDEELLKEDGKAHCEVTKDILELIDVLVDGEFVEAKKNLMLPFRGSENQRLIDVQESLQLGMVVEYQLRNPK